MTDQISSIEEHKRMNLYLTLMHEACIRFEVINNAYRNEAGFPPQIVREICYLQFRLLCEIIAVGCLVAHGNTPKRLSDLYEADKIVNEMEKLKPHFFPEPVDIQKKDGRVLISGKPADQHLTRMDLVKLWGICGNTLHRSPLSKLIKSRNKDPVDFSDISDWSKKITALLNNHLIALSDTRAMLVLLKNAETGKPLIQVIDFSLTDNQATIVQFRGI